MEASRDGRRSVLLAVFVATCGVLPAFLTGGLAVQIRSELDFGDSALGLAVSIFFVASALVSAGAGRVVELVGYRVGLRVGAMMAAATLLGVPLLAHSWWMLVVLLAFGGMANAVSQPAAHLMLAREVASTRQGMAFGIKQAAIPASTLLAGLAVPAFGLTVGWRWAFALCAVGALSMALVMTSSHKNASIPRSEAQRQRRRRPSLMVFAIGVGLGSAAAVPLGAFTVGFGVRSGLTPELAGLLLASGSVVGIVTRIIVGWRADQRDGNHFLVVVAMLCLGAVGLAMISSGTALLLGLGAALAFGAGWGWNGLFNFAVVKNNRSAPAAATGVTQTGVAAGSALGPAAFGLIVEHGTYEMAWLSAAGLALVAAGTIFLGRYMLIWDKKAKA